MSKSLGNVVSIDDLLDNYTANQFRLFCLLSHYNQSESKSNISYELNVYHRIPAHISLHRVIPLMSSMCTAVYIWIPLYTAVCLCIPCIPLYTLYIPYIFLFNSLYCRITRVHLCIHMCTLYAVQASSCPVYLFIHLYTSHPYHSYSNLSYWTNRQHTDRLYNTMS